MALDYLLAGLIVQVVECRELNNLVLQMSHCIQLSIFPFEGDTFPCKINKWSSNSGKITNKNMDHFTGPEKSTDLCKVLILHLVPDLLDFSLMLNTAFEGILVTNNASFRGSEHKFLGRDYHIDILQALEDSVDNGQMISNEQPYAEVLWNDLIKAI